MKMKLITESDFFSNCQESLKQRLYKTVDSTIEKTKAREGDKGEGATKYTFDNSRTILVIFYKYRMVSDNVYNASFEIYHGKEINDFILDKLNEMKKLVESRGEKFIWE